MNNGRLSRSGAPYIIQPDKRQSCRLVPRFARGALIYNGDPHNLSDGISVLSFRDAAPWFTRPGTSA